MKINKRNKDPDQVPNPYQTRFMSYNWFSIIVLVILGLLYMLFASIKELIIFVIKFFNRNWYLIPVVIIICIFLILLLNNYYEFIPYDKDQEPCPCTELNGTLYQVPINELGCHNWEGCRSCRYENGSVFEFYHSTRCLLYGFD